MKKRKSRIILSAAVLILVIIIFLVIAGLRGGNALPSTSKWTDANIPNPASVNCIDKGGKLSIVKSGSGGEYGICEFEDGKECEEWALFRGECPMGGVKVTGFYTEEAKYCAITGGNYSVADEKTPIEQGVCSFPDSRKCDAWKYYNGTCDI